MSHSYFTRGELSNSKMNLTVEKIKEITAEKDEKSVKILNASRKDIKHVHDLSSCLKLERLDLSYNSLTNFKGIRECLSLTWLNIAHNQIETLSAVGQLRHLKVLNASHNNIIKCGDLSRLTELKALILNNNGELSAIPGLNKLTGLNTLVLSHNSFVELDGISSLSRLTKLSLTHNSLQAVPDTSVNHELMELRLNGNHIKKLPSHLRSNTKLRVLDIGNNKIKKLKNIEILKEVRALRNLNVKGNPLYNDQDDGMIKLQIRQLLPKLEILDVSKVHVSSLKISSSKKPVQKLTKASSTISELKNEPFSSTNEVSSVETETVLAEGCTVTVSHITDEVNEQSNKQSSKVKADKRLSKTRKRPSGQSNVLSIEECCMKRTKSTKIELSTALEEDTKYGVGGASFWN